MRGIVLAAGRGTRLQPMTKYVSKLLLPVYDAPMIEHPLRVMHELGIEQAMIVLDPEHHLQVRNYLGGHYKTMSLSYALQPCARGTADALKIARAYAGDEAVAVMLGDQYMTHLPLISRFKDGALCFYQEVSDVSNYGSITIDAQGMVDSISEKPPGHNKGNALAGFYLFDKQVWNFLDTLELSARGEYELTDALRQYARQGTLEARKLKGFWTDAGTPEALYIASGLARQKRQDDTNEMAGRYV